MLYKVRVCVGSPGGGGCEEKFVDEKGLSYIKWMVNDIELHGYYASYEIIGRAGE